MHVLNDYHVQFLHHLARYRVRYLVVGGQAQKFFQPSHVTRDLDVWVSVADVDTPALEGALVSWSQDHRTHTELPLDAPLPLRPGVQIAFPDCDGVLYLSRNGEMHELSTADRIDVLTSIAGMSFDECFARSVEYNVEGVAIRAFCAADLDEAERLRSG